MKLASIGLLSASLASLVQARWTGDKKRDIELAYCKVEGADGEFGGKAYLAQIFDEELGDIMVHSYWYNVPEVDGILFKVNDSADCTGTELSSNETEIMAVGDKVKVKSTFMEDLDDLISTSAI